MVIHSLSESTLSGTISGLVLGETGTPRTYTWYASSVPRAVACVTRASSTSTTFIPASPLERLASSLCGSAAVEPLAIVGDSACVDAKRVSLGLPSSLKSVQVTPSRLGAAGGSHSRTQFRAALCD